MVPVLFAFGGWQTANFIATEIKDPRRNLSRALVLGVAGVIVLYFGVNYVCVRALGAEGLAASTVPASAVMRLTLGSTGATVDCAGHCGVDAGISEPVGADGSARVFCDGVGWIIFSAVARIDAKTHVPVLAIVMQSVLTLVIALSGSYEKILNYVVSIDFIFFGLTGASLFVFRRRDARWQRDIVCPGIRGRPAVFVAACWLVVGNTIYGYPANTVLGLGILALGVPVYGFWARTRKLSAVSD